MFDRLSDRSRKAFALARKEALRLNHDFIGTEHILMGLIRERTGSAVQALRDLGVEIAGIRQALEKHVRAGLGASPLGQLPFAPGATNALDHSVEEAKELGHQQIRTGHLLLGLMREGEGVAGRVLRDLGLELDDVRREMCAFVDRRIVSKDLTTVFRGSPEEAQVLRPILQELGFFTHLANHTIKTYDPFITGVGMFDLELQVPQDQAEHASKALREIQSEKVDDTEPDDQDHQFQLEASGRRLRWASVAIGCTVLSSPLAFVATLLYVVFYVRYVVRVLHLGVRPRAHTLTLASALLVAVYALVAVFLWVM